MMGHLQREMRYFKKPVIKRGYQYVRPTVFYLKMENNSDKKYVEFV